jgi:3-oxoacyl-[acyl-carrier protein] reductase
MELPGKTIAITGGGRGLGAAMATRLARKGCHLALIDIDEATLRSTAEQCAEEGAPETGTWIANVADESEVETTFGAIVEQFGALHGLINNAGITRDALTLKYKDGSQVGKMSLAEWQQVIDVNLTGSFLCGREAAAQMIALGSKGCIINISSISRSGNIGQANYSASKAGVESLAVVWAKEFARHGIRVASIAPGFVGTEMVMAMKPEARDKLTSAIPLGRIGDPDEIARTAEFILENDYVSGRCFEIDGALRL